ncbi:MAG: hypothetical protein GX591_00680 [Planctomycetes bacterium]|nr:hypothetical protein [Planctomycetota bacterium]
MGHVSHRHEAIAARGLFVPPHMETLEGRVLLSAAGDGPWATFLGSTGWDTADGIALDADGNVLVTGTTGLADFAGGANELPAANAPAGASDAFVAKLTPDGRLLWATYVGGSGSDAGFGVAADSAGNVLVAGSTFSTDLGGAGGAANNSAKGASDAFVAKLTPDGALTWVTYLGGAGLDSAAGLAVDAADHVLVTGTTTSSAFAGGSNDAAANNTFQGGPWPDAGDAFVARLTPAGALAWATYLGGDDYDNGAAVAADDAGNVLVTGQTSSAVFTGGSNLATTNNAFKGNNDAFAARLSPDGTLTWATCLGGGGYDEGLDVAADAAGNALVLLAAGTDVRGGANDAPANNAPKGKRDTLVARLAPDGTLAWATYLGGGDHDWGGAIAADAAGNALVTGYTLSPSLTGGSNDGVVANSHAPAYLEVFAAAVTDAGALQWAVFLGGSRNEEGIAIAADADGSLYVAGETDSVDFASSLPANNALHGTVNDAFVAKLTYLPSPVGGDADTDGDVDLDDFVILKQNFGALGATWDQGDFDASGAVDLDDFVLLKQNFGAGAMSVNLLTTATPATDVEPVRPRPRRLRRRLRREPVPTGVLDLLAPVRLGDV